jgi:D-glycero-D-manno-heptose 1,7-bisphosphate phosphatase
VKSPEEFVFLPDAKEALRILTKHGLRIFVVTNQRGIALRRMTEDDLARIHFRMLRELEAGGGRVEAIYHCPHDRGDCSCRKPKVGMFLQARREHPEIALAESVVIGDSEVDMEAAARLGMRSVLVVGEDSSEPSVPATYRAASLLDAATWVTRFTTGRARS